MEGKRLTLTKRPEYEIKGDSAGHFNVGQIITDFQYDSVKEDYDIRIKEWDGDEKIIHISGRKRDLMKGFLEERRYVLTSEYYHYCVRSRGKKVDPVAISLKIHELGLRYLRVHIIGGTGPNSISRK